MAESYVHSTIRSKSLRLPSREPQRDGSHGNLRVSGTFLAESYGDGCPQATHERSDSTALAINTARISKVLCTYAESRYARQELLFGKEGQEKLGKKKVAIVGMGALGTVAAELLVRAGVGHLVLIDRDIIEETNLQRQTLYGEKDVGKSKATVAKEKLTRINSAVEIEAHAIHLNYGYVDLLRADVVLDCTDNLKTRFLINDFCRRENIPWIYAAAIKTSGYVMPILPNGPCLRCFLQEASMETCDTVGVLNTITNAVASLQVTQALKLLLGKEGGPMLYHYDIWNSTFKTLKVNRKAGCPACQGNYESLMEKEEAKLVHFCGTGRYQIKGKVDVAEVKEGWKKIDTVIDDGTLISFRDITLFRDGRAFIKAKSEEEALSVYAKWVGG